MPHLVRALPAAAATERGLWEPRADVVVERADGPDRFTAVTGPYEGYERTLEIDGDTVTEHLRYRMAPGFRGFPFGFLHRTALRRDGRAGPPWWGSPEVIDARAASTIGSLCAIALVAGYLGTLLTQTVTFAADDFDATTTAQSATLAFVRVGVLVSVLLTTLADRRGRRRLLLLCCSVGCAVSALSALSPNLAVLGLTQLGVRTMVTSCTVLLTVIAAEEMPRGARAYGVTVLGLSGAVGVGVCLIALPLADWHESGWRLLYLVPLLGLPILARAARNLPESRRFEVPHDEVAMSGHGRRLWLLAVSALLLNLFKDPASQLLNEFLRDERDFSAFKISLFSIATNVPGLLGVVVGGRLADVRGRRAIGAVAVLGGAGFTVVQMLTGGWPMWTWSLIASVIGAASLPALGVYGPELFPTSLRGRANGVIAVAATVGTVVGLLAAGILSDRWDGLGPALAALSIGPAIVGVLILVAYPETAKQELEDLNPEDPTLPGAAPVSPSGPPATG